MCKGLECSVSTHGTVCAYDMYAACILGHVTCSFILIAILAPATYIIHILRAVLSNCCPVTTQYRTFVWCLYLQCGTADPHAPLAVFFALKIGKIDLTIDSAIPVRKPLSYAACVRRALRDDEPVAALVLCSAACRSTSGRPLSKHDISSANTCSSPPSLSVTYIHTSTRCYRYTSKYIICTGTLYCVI